MSSSVLAFVGLPGSGIAPVGSEIAAVLNRPFVEYTGDHSSLSVGGTDAVVAVPVHSLKDRAVRSWLRDQTETIWIDAPDQLLAAASNSSVADVAELRRSFLGPLTVSSDGLVHLDEGQRPIDVVAQVEKVRAGLVERPLVRVERVELAGDRGYPIVVGRGVRHSIADHLPERAKKVAIVTQEGIGVDVDTGRDQRVFTVADGESAKRLDEVGRLGSELAKWGMTRADCVVAVGGGVVTDLGGFLAASYHRGIPVVHVATTLLGQIDAAIGGKCGVNLPEGKNLMGAFWQPHAVICDVDTLDTLPEREFRAGMGELAKYHYLGGGRLDRVEIVERVARSVAIKADVVSGDEREGGRRAILNYGHTLAHALETLSGYGTMLHGEAVAVGLIYAAELAHRLGRINPDSVDEHRAVVASYGLETKIDASLDPEAIVDLFARDKKAIDGVTFVLDGPNGVEPVKVENRQLLLECLSAVR